MSKRIFRRALSSLLGLAIMVSLFPSSVFASETKPPEDPLSSQVLISDWKIAPSTENSLGITPVDTLEADTATWTPAAVPGTVLESLKAAGLTEAKSQDFESGWWYAAKLAIPGEDVISALEFRGITGDATLFINGTQVPSSQVIATDDGYYLVTLDGLAAAGEIADIRLLVSHPESATATDGSIGLTGAVYLDTAAAPQASAMALATPTEVPSFSEKLTNWKIAPSAAGTTCRLPAMNDDAALASDAANWIPAKVPGTVEGSLLEAGIYDELFTANAKGEKDVYYSDNLSKIPYTDFSQPYWYTTQFSTPAGVTDGTKVNLQFRGISNMADIYINGTKLINTSISVTSEDFLKDDPAVLTGTPGPLVDPGTKGTDNNSLYQYRSSSFDTYKNLFIGGFRTYDLNVTDYLNTDGSPNVIKIKVTKPTYKADFTGMFADWAPQPHDSVMGLTNPVTLSTSGAVRLSNPAVATKLNDALTSADLTFYVDVNNMTDAAVTGKLTGVIKAPDGTKVADISKENIVVAAGAYAQGVAIKYTMPDPELWWPYLYGDHPLYTVEYNFTIDEKASDALNHRFGVREISAEVNASAKATGNNAEMLQVYVNHKPVLLKGGGYCPPDLYLRGTKMDDAAVVQYVKYMGMNMLRNEGKFYNDELLDLLDENGIVLVSDFMCCDQFQNSAKFNMADRFVAYETLYSTLRSLRSHPSMVLWLNGSDEPPAKMVEYKYMEIEAYLHFTEMGTVSSNCSAYKSSVTGKLSGLHMDSTYTSQTPTWFYADPEGNMGFISEGGGGFGIPVRETIETMIPQENLWPYNVTKNFNVWNYQSTRGIFRDMTVQIGYLDGTYGVSDTLDEFLMKSQVFDYDLQRAQYEALTVNRFVSTSGFVNWMLNGSRPSVHWNMFDYYMNPHGSTFGAHKANEPVHILYDMYNKDVYVVNNTLEDYSGLTATMTLYNIDGKAISQTESKSLNLAAAGAPTPVAGTNAITPEWAGLRLDENGDLAHYEYNYNGKITESYGINKLWDYDAIQKAMTNPSSDVYFIRLELKDATGKVISYNSYAEPMRSDVAELSRHRYYQTGTAQTADLTQLNSLPAVTLSVRQTGSEIDDGSVTQTIEVTNPTEHIAYAVELKAYTTEQKTALVAPVFFSDNLFTLFPGETRIVTVSHAVSVLSGDATITMNCYNNVIQNKPARTVNLYTGMGIGGGRNLAKNKPVTMIMGALSSDVDENKPKININRVTEVLSNVETYAGNGNTFVECDASFGVISDYSAQKNALDFYIDLGSVQSFDRMILRWQETREEYYGHSEYRPGKIEISVCDADPDTAVWTNVKTINDNNVKGYTVTDLTLDAPVSARYVRVKASEPMELPAAVGNMASAAAGNGYNGYYSQTRTMTSQKLTCAAVELYSFRSAAYLDIMGAGSVTVDGKTYTSAMNANQRAVLVAADGALDLTVAPTNPGTAVVVLQDGKDLTDRVDNGTLALTGITKDTTITVRFGVTAENFSTKLANWKISPTEAGTTSGLPALDNDAAVVKSNFDTSKWIDAVVPGTVLGNLINQGVYDKLFVAGNDGSKDVHFADNMAKIPFQDFEKPWWYATSFELPADQAGKQVNLSLQGISYMADIYVNGVKLSNKNISVAYDDLLDDTGIVAAGINNDPSGELTSNITVKNGFGTSTLNNLGYNKDDSRTAEADRKDPLNNYNDYKDEFIGTFRHYDVDITDYVTPGETVDIKIKVTRPLYGSDNDLTYYWVDWNPCPPDSNMGLTGNVTISTSGAVRLSNPAVAAKVATDYSKADLTFYVDANNMTDAAVEGILSGTIRKPDGTTLGNIAPQTVTVAANAYSQEIAVECSLPDPELWWPYLSGGQPLYHIDYTFTPTGGTASDNLTHRFGIRQIDVEINYAAKAVDNSDPEDVNTDNADMMQVYVNHKPVMLKGGGYSPTDLFLRHSQETNQAVVDYVKYMGMNMVRDEGKFFDNDLLDLFDENGIVFMPGWCCCDRHQQTGKWSLAERFVGYEGQYSQMRNLRQHAGMFVWFNGSDNPPSAKMVEYSYFRIEANLRWFDIGAVVASGSGNGSSSPLTGKGGGQHMDAAYDTQTPTFYYSDPLGTFGFVSEGGGGASIPALESLRKIIPDANLWPYNSAENYNVWNYHACRGGSFSNLTHTMSFYDNTYGPSGSIEESIARANAFLYDSQRAQFEAQAYFRYTDTAGIVNWMLNGARPTLYWNQFDYYMNPNASTFGTAKANEPVHIMYNPYDGDIALINSTFNTYDGMTATAVLYDISGKVISSELTKTLNVAADGITGRDTSNVVPQWIGLELNDKGGYDKVTYDRLGQVTGSSGVNHLWTNAQIKAALTGELTDVTFLRLELKDSTGKVVSYNSYAVPMRGDVALANHNWNRSMIHQNADLTQLNQLPNVNLTVSNGSVTKAGGKVSQDVTIANQTNSIAYSVELKAYMDATKKDLVAPVIYSDNLFILFPGETRVITVTHNQSVLDAAAVITVSCYNNVINQAGEDPAITNIYAGKGDAPYNLAKGKTVSVIGGTAPTKNDVIGNILAIPEAAETRAANGNTFIESDLATRAVLSDENIGFVVDLGSTQAFDRIIVRWNNWRSGNAPVINTRPDTVKVEVSKDNNTWMTVVNNYDNTKSGGVMSDFALASTATARYIKVTPTGHMGIAAAYGVVDLTGVSGGVGQGTPNVAELKAATTFTVAGFEVYAYSDTPPVEPDQVTVTFESNGGSAVNAVSVEAGSTIAAPTNPTRSGYTFVAWYADEALTAAWDFATDTVDANITLYAKWSSQGTGGNPAPVSGDKTTTVTLPDGTVVKTVTKTNGTIITTETHKDGVVIVTTATPAGKISAEVTLPKDMTSAEVIIPAEKMGPGTVAYLVNPDGSKTLVTKSYAGENGVVVPVTGSVKLEIVDNGKPFSDVTGTAWYVPAVAFASGHELFQGTSAALFAPESPMTRAMLMTVLARLEGKDTSKGETWYSVGVEWAKSVGISDGTNLEGNITREQLAAMLYRYAKAEKTTGTLNAFPDAGQVSPWAVDAMAWAVEQGIIQGSGGRLNPAGNASRAEVATMLMRFVMNLNP